MQSTNFQEISVPADVVIGLLAVLTNAKETNQLTPAQLKSVLVYAATLELALEKKEQSAKIGLSIQLIANILRIILMIVKPDPIVKAAISLFWRGL